MCNFKMKIWNKLHWSVCRVYFDRVQPLIFEAPQGKDVKGEVIFDFARSSRHHFLAVDSMDATV